MDMIKTITDWPAIVQGVLGSALFWIILELGQQSFRHISTKLGKDKTTAKSFALTAHEAVGELQVTARFFCLYGSAHYFVKAMIVDDDGLLALLARFEGKAFVHGMSDHVERVEYRISLKTVEDFLQVTAIEPRLRAILASENFKDLGESQQRAVKTFLDTVDGKTDHF